MSTTHHLSRLGVSGRPWFQLGDVFGMSELCAMVPAMNTKPAAPKEIPSMTTPAIRSGAVSRWVTASAAVIAAVGAVAAAYNSFVERTANELMVSGAVKPGYEAVCVAYSNFVLTQAHNGYTPEQIQQVINFAGSHSLMPGQPDHNTMPNRWPTISDANACGTPAQVIAQTKKH